MTDSQAATLNPSQSYASQINWSGPTPSLPVAPKQSAETKEPAPAPPSAAEVVGGAITTGEGLLGGLGKGITTIGATTWGFLGTLGGWFIVALTIPTDSPRNDTMYSKSGSDTVQTGGNTIGRGTAKALNEYSGKNLSDKEWGRALEGLKKDNEIPNDNHGKILRDGSYIDGNGQDRGNINEYTP